MRRLLYPDWHNPGTSAGLLILRLVMGAAFVIHGWGKIRTPFSWAGENFPGYFQLLAAVAEFGGGIALILGLLTRLGALGIAITMAVAATTVHMRAGDPFVATRPGSGSYEMAAVYFACALLFLIAGPGRISADACLFGPRGRMLQR
jgi:putative oxidoreductase